MKSSDKDNHFKPQILFSDNHICVAIKPPGMVVPIENNKVENLEQYLKSYFQNLLGKDTVFIRPIHRIDKPVGGIVVFARSSKAVKRLQQSQRAGEIKKFYVAKVHGLVSKSKEVLTHELIHGDYRAEIVKSGGKEAKLYYRRLKSNHTESLLSICLLTGRYHQIRIQLSSIGHPIIGDNKYGSTKKLERRKILLYHTKISFPHPTTRKKMVFTARPNYF